YERRHPDVEADVLEVEGRIDLSDTEGGAHRAMRPTAIRIEADCFVLDRVVGGDIDVEGCRAVHLDGDPRGIIHPGSVPRKQVDLVRAIEDGGGEGAVLRYPDGDLLVQLVRGLPQLELNAAAADPHRLPVVEHPPGDLGGRRIVVVEGRDAAPREKERGRQRGTQNSLLTHGRFTLLVCGSMEGIRHELRVVPERARRN